MQTLQMPSSDHPELELACEELDEWEPLPAVRTTPSDETYETEQQEEVAPVDGLILAGLVRPY